jgi:hypothetical protein
MRLRNTTEIAEFLSETYRHLILIGFWSNYGLVVKIA